MTELTQQRLKEVIEYDPATGTFKWLGRRGCAAAGKEAGCLSPVGYIVVRVNGKLYTAHRLAWLYVNGEWPSGHIDHINRNKIDNRISNLRLCNDAENGQNARLSSANKSGVRGVHLTKRGLWQAQIMVNRKNIYLGRYENLEDASRARKTAEEKYFPFKVSGDKAIEGIRHE